MKKKIKCMKLTANQVSSISELDDYNMSVLKELLEDMDETMEPYEVSIVMLTREEIDALPEFMGF